MSDKKTTAREFHLAVEFVKSCPPNTGRPAALAHAFAEYRAELARDPQFILAAVEKLLREAEAGTVVVESNPEACVYWRGVGYCARTLTDAYAKLVAARKGGSDV